MEKTFLMIKPDGVQRNLIGPIVERLENKGFKLAGAKLMHVSEELAKTHYQEHQDKPFFGELVDFITSGPVFAMVLAVKKVIITEHLVVAATNPQQAAPGTIRGHFGLTLGKNTIPGSDSPKFAERKMGL